MIVDHIKKEAEKGLSCLVLSERISHVKELLGLYSSNSTVPTAALTGRDSRTGNGRSMT